jgi:hypothetical protein
VLEVTTNLGAASAIGGSYSLNPTSKIVLSRPTYSSFSGQVHLSYTPENNWIISPLLGGGRESALVSRFSNNPDSIVPIALSTSIIREGRWNPNPSLLSDTTVQVQCRSASGMCL